MQRSSTLAKTATVAAAASAALALSMGMASPAKALTFNGSGGSIPDFSNNTPGVFTSDIVVGNNFQIADLTVTLNNLSHTWVGDLTATLEKVGSGITVNLFNRVGRVNSGVGDSSNLGGGYSFNNSFTGNLWIAATGGGNGFTIPGGNYFPTGANSAALASPSLSAFFGQNVAGTWRLRITDNAESDRGSLGSWQLTATPVPTPILLPGLLGFGIGVLRQRKKGAAAEAENN